MTKDLKDVQSCVVNINNDVVMITQQKGYLLDSSSSVLFRFVKWKQEEMEYNNEYNQAMQSLLLLEFGE